MIEKIVFFVFLTNTALCLTQYTVQLIDNLYSRIPDKGTTIPGTEQKFLYWENFFTQTWGDLLFLPLTAVAFTLLIKAGEISITDYTGGIIVGAVVVWIFLRSCTSPKHKPDWGFPKTGKVSPGGWSHIPYLGIYGGLIAVTLSHVDRLNQTGLTLLGVGISGWLLTWLIDYLSGHFQSIKYGKNFETIN